MRTLIYILLFILSAPCFAIPAKISWRKVALENGDSIMVTMRGDELCHFLVTEDGVPVIEVQDGIYRLAPEDSTKICDRWKERMDKRNEQRAKRRGRNENTSRLHKAFGQPSSYYGKKKGIVILVNFSNKTMQDNAQELFDIQFNQVGYSLNDHIGSVHDYFYDQSYGQFDLEFDIYGPITLSNKMEFYGKNNRDGDDMYPGVMIEEACKAVNMKYKPTWSDYDWNGDGEVNQVVCIYAGYGEHASGRSNEIWPHECTLDEEKSIGDGNGSFTLGGVKINTYAVSCELVGSRGTKIDGIGTACHEFAHCMGIPDFYDTYQSSTKGMGAWDLMDSGSYNGPSLDGEVPAGFTAYERWFCGWLDFKELDKPCKVTDMPALQDEPCAYIIYNDGNRNEYFTLENRQSNRWFKYIGNYTGAHGMLAVHVDYDKKAWEENTPNVEKNHQRMSVIPASNILGNTSSLGYKQKLFPGLSNVTELTDDSHYNKGAELFNKNTDGSYNMNKPITNIEEMDGRISFLFMMSEEDAISAPEALDTTDAEYYTLSGVKVKAPTSSGIYALRKGDKVLRMSIHR